MSNGEERMPRKIIVRVSGEGAKKQESQPPTGEDMPVIEPVSEAVETREEQQQEAEPQLEVASEEEPEEALVESAINHYEKLKSDIENVRKRDFKFQELCIRETVPPRAIREILTRLNELRSKIVNDSRRTLEILEQAKAQLEERFSKVEVDLYWASLELNTLQLDETASSKGDVGLKEELEARIPQLRQELSMLRNRIKELEEKIHEISELPRTINDVTTSRELADRILEEVKKRYVLSHGTRAEAMLTADVQRLMERDNIPREYAIILLWKKIKGAV
ncbi:MAG: hypothetical protein NXY59_05850 [Aigarchaeota archaeon]|nr:hypothetical protein [Candidatus Pelearchaeum maunauluense]